MSARKANDDSHPEFPPSRTKARDRLDTTSARSSSHFHFADKFLTPHCIVSRNETVQHADVHSGVSA
jgi:hypothetical protein